MYTWLAAAWPAPGPATGGARNRDDPAPRYTGQAPKYLHHLIVFQVVQEHVGDRIIEAAVCERQVEHISAHDPKPPAAALYRLGGGLWQ